LQVQQQQRRRRQRQVIAVTALVIGGLGLFGAFQAGQASHQAQRAQTWGERLAVSTVHDVAAAGQTALALTLAQHMRQELQRDGEQQATLAATMRTIAELAEDRFDWSTAREAWQATEAMAPEWQRLAQRGVFRVGWATQALQRRHSLGDQHVALVRQKDLLSADFFFHQSANEMWWHSQGRAAGYAWPDGLPAAPRWLYRMLLDGALRSVQQQLPTVLDPSERALLAAVLAVEQGNLSQARETLDVLLPQLEAVALRESQHPGHRWRWQLARFYRIACGDYVASSERMANADQLWDLAGLAGAPLFWRVFAARALLAACRATPRHAFALELLDDIDLTAFLQPLPEHHQQRLWKRYFQTAIHLAQAHGDLQRIEGLAAEYAEYSSGN
jgi:hypothetical protein